MDDVFLRHCRVPAPLEVGGRHRVGEEEGGELAGQQETADSFEHLQAVGRGVLSRAHFSSKFQKSPKAKAKSTKEIESKSDCHGNQSSEY